LNRDAGHDPVYAGPIENAAAQETIALTFVAIGQQIGPFVYRMAAPEEL
jgi:predicted dinucleotide-binding enzyme